MLMTDPRIIVAIDTSDFEKANAILEQLNPDLCLVKIGSVVFNALGKSFLKHASSQGFKIFLDLKLHDIPNTVSKAIEEIAQFNVLMTTIHLQGGMEMIAAANQAKGRIKILGVTLLTDLSVEFADNNTAISSV